MLNAYPAGWIGGSTCGKGSWVASNPEKDVKAGEMMKLAAKMAVKIAYIMSNTTHAALNSSILGQKKLTC
jgi:hypothetical protein